MTIPAFPVYLFDVDGTLTDSAPDICGSVEVVLDKHGLPPQSRRYLQSFIGKHLQELWAELIPGLTPEHSETLTQEYRQVYWARNHSSTRLYPGVAEMLAALGGRKSTATTKGTPTTRVVLEMFGLIQFFDHIQGTTAPHAPSGNEALISGGADRKTPHQKQPPGADGTSNLAPQLHQSSAQ